MIIRHEKFINLIWSDIDKGYFIPNNEKINEEVNKFTNNFIALSPYHLLSSHVHLYPCISLPQHVHLFTPTAPLS